MASKTPPDIETLSRHTRALASVIVAFARRRKHVPDDNPARTFTGVWIQAGSAKARAGSVQFDKVLADLEI